MQGGANADYCADDDAYEHCLVSCGMCTDPDADASCWAPPTYTFQMCCGGPGGDPDCFNEEFSMARCCGFDDSNPEPCVDQAMTPSCAEIVALGHSCTAVLPLADDSDPSLEAGQALGAFCPATCGMCGDV